MNLCGRFWPSQKTTCQTAAADCIHWENECGWVCILSVTVVINRVSHLLLRFVACALPARKMLKQHTQRNISKELFCFLSFVNPMQTISLPVLSFVRVVIWQRSRAFHHLHSKRSSLQGWPATSPSVPFLVCLFLCVNPVFLRASCCWFLRENMCHKTFSNSITSLLQNLSRALSNTC